MVAKHAGRRGRPWRRTRAHVLSRSRMCWWCGHGGANAVDHVVPIVKGGSRTDPANLRPIHGVERCSTCGRACNSEKGSSTNAPPSMASEDW